jgi:hypothetical protein
MKFTSFVTRIFNQGEQINVIFSKETFSESLRPHLATLLFLKKQK